MTAAVTSETELLPIDISTLNFTAEQFERLCAANPDRSLELTTAGVLIVMPPVGGESGKREFKLIGQLFDWNEETKLGEAFSSSTIFRLPLGSQRSPDVAWIERDRWEALTLAQREQFPPIAPDFVIELRSRTDRLSDLQAKMLEYRANGVRLGWLIDPQQQIVEIYRSQGEVEILQSPTALSGEDVLPGFVLNLTKIW
jgi:Uma2 family endonuclease